MIGRADLLDVLDRARWAPSGDNTQPWRFEIVDDDHVAVHGFDTRDEVVYDFLGWPSRMAHGALLETIQIAAAEKGLGVSWEMRSGCPPRAPIYDVHFATGQGKDGWHRLSRHIESRVVQRRPMSTKPLSEAQRETLRTAVGEGYQLVFFESASARFKVARLLWRSAYIRLTCPEAFKVHRDIIEWGARFSYDRLPEKAVGTDPLTGVLMKWVMQSWSRVEFFNRYLLGTVAPRLQLDFLPAIACAGHILLVPKQPLASDADFVEAGRAMQRLWLTVAAEGLFLQPEMTPVIFRWYNQRHEPLSANTAVNGLLAPLAQEFEILAGVQQETPFAFMCRVGYSEMPQSRSLRKPLSDLMVESTR